MNANMKQFVEAHRVRENAGMREGIVEALIEAVVTRCMLVAQKHTPDTEECDYTWLISNKIAEEFGMFDD